MPMSMLEIAQYLDQHCFPGYRYLSADLQVDFEQKTLLGQWIVTCLQCDYPSVLMPYADEQSEGEAPRVQASRVGQVVGSVGWLTWKTLSSVFKLVRLGSVVIAVENSVEGWQQARQREQWLERRDQLILNAIHQASEKAPDSQIVLQLARDCFLGKNEALYRQQAVLRGTLEQMLSIYMRTIKNKRALLLIMNYYIQQCHDIMAKLDTLSQLMLTFEAVPVQLMLQLFPQPIATPLLAEMQTSVASLFSHKKVRAVYLTLKRWASAHAFIQYLGFSTQNEASWMASLDIYNYWEYNANIEEAKGVIAGIIRMFYPIYREYQDIAKYEKNGLMKIVRAVMPVMIIVLLIIAVLTPLALVGIPDLALFFVIIPTLFLGLYLATLYVSTKDRIYDWLRTQYYGGEYHLPEYALNSRLDALFGVNATTIRTWYIDRLKETKKQQEQYRQCIVLTEKQQSEKEANGKQMVALMLEWVDLHDNVDCTIEQAHQLVKARISEQYNQALATLKSTYQKPLETALHASCLTQAAECGLATDHNQVAASVLSDQCEQETTESPSARVLFFSPSSVSKAVEPKIQTEKEDFNWFDFWQARDALTKLEHLLERVAKYQ